MKNKDVEKRKKELIKELALLYDYDIEKDNAKISKEEIEAKRKVNVKDYLEGFDKEFDTYTKEKPKTKSLSNSQILYKDYTKEEIPLIINLYQEFLQEVYQPSKRYQLAIRIKKDIDKDIEKTFTEEQQELMKQYKECQNIIINDMTEEAFVYGYCMATELREEAIKRYGKVDIDKK